MAASVAPLALLAAAGVPAAVATLATSRLTLSVGAAR